MAAQGGLRVDLGDPERALESIRAAARSEGGFAAVVAPDDATVELAGRVASELGLAGNPPGAARLSRRKDLARARLAAAGVRVPAFRVVDLRGPLDLTGVPFPCVVKPIAMSASRGVSPRRRPRGARGRDRAGAGHRGRCGGRGRTLAVADRVLRPRAGGRGRGPAHRRPARGAGDLRQARPPRRPVLRGEHLRDPEPARPDRRGGASSNASAGRWPPSASWRGRCMPRSGGTRERRGCSRPPRAPSGASARSSFASAPATAWRNSCWPRRWAGAFPRSRLRGGRGHDAAHPPGGDPAPGGGGARGARRAGGGRGIHLRRNRCRARSAPRRVGLPRVHLCPRETPGFVERALREAAARLDIVISPMWRLSPAA